MLFSKSLDERVIRRGDWTWRVRPELADKIDLLERAILKVEKREGVKTVKETGGRRTIWTAPLGISGIGDVFIKHYSAPRFSKQLKHLVRNSRTRQEWEMGVRLDSIGLPTARHLAMAERTSGRLLQEDFLVQEKLLDYENFDDRWRRRFESESGSEGAKTRREEIEKLAALIRKMHGLKVLQRDFKPDSIMVSREGDYRFVDLERALVSATPLSFATRLDNLAKIDQTFGFIGGATDRLRFLRAYFPDKSAGELRPLAAAIAINAEIKFRKRARERRIWTAESNVMYRVHELRGYRVSRHWSLSREYIADVISRIERGLSPATLAYPGHPERGIAATWCRAGEAMAHTASLYYRRIPFLPGRAAILPGDEEFGLFLSMIPPAPISDFVSGFQRDEGRGSSRDFLLGLGRFLAMIHRMGLTWREPARDMIWFDPEAQPPHSRFYVGRLDLLALDRSPDAQEVERIMETVSSLLGIDQDSRAILRAGYSRSKLRWFRVPERW